MLTDPGRVPIGRRAWLGNGGHGATLAPDGTVDWYASGGVGTPPDLWRLLDDSGPAVRVGPRRDGPGSRRHLPDTDMAYVAGTAVVHTVATGPGGRRVSTTDFLPWDGRGPGEGSIFGGFPALGGGPGSGDPTGSVVRLVRALSGPVEVEVEVMCGADRRPGGGRRTVTPTATGLLLDGLAVTAAEPFTPAPLERDTARWRSITRLDDGEEMVVVIGPGDPMGPDAAHRLLDRTVAAWRSWVNRVVYAGPHRHAVERALITVRSLTAPSGAPVAAGTTSLPRRVGSERSSDSRWVHLRNVTAAVPVLADAGLADDARAAETWLRHTLSNAHLPWPAWFDADGQPVPEPEEVPYAGWRGSQPVVLGRPGGIDLGLLGGVVGAVGASGRGLGGRADDPGPLSAASGVLADAADWVTDHWREPDHGRWGIPKPPRLYSAGRVEAWRALTGSASRARQANPLDLRAAVWHQEARQILRWLEEQARSGDGGLRMDGALGAPDEPDAALLAVAHDGPWPASHPVVATTVDRILERLSSGGLLHRYSERVSDEAAGPDLADLEASLLTVRALSALERWDEAHERLERVTGLVGAAGPGLLSETADPVSGELFGNLPSVGASLALVDAAGALQAGPR